MSLRLAGVLCVAMALSASSQSPSAAAPAAAAAAADAKVPAVQAVLYLRTEVSSGGTKAGKIVKADLERTVTLPGGQMLPKGTTFTGTVLDVSRHSKEKPNGTLLLEFNRAYPKGGGPVDVVVRIEKLSPADAGGSTTLPMSNGGMVSLAGNSGGGAMLNSQMNDRSDLAGKYKDSSTIQGVYVTAANQGSGLVFSLREDCYLDADIRMTVLLAAAPAAK